MGPVHSHHILLNRDDRAYHAHRGQEEADRQPPPFEPEGGQTAQGRQPDERQARLVGSGLERHDPDGYQLRR